MAYDENLAERVRMHLGSSLVEKKMFGGIGFLLNGNICCGVHGNNLIIRLDPADVEVALRKPGARVFDLTGRPMKGWLFVAPEAVADDSALAAWIDGALHFTATLPAK